MPSWVSRGVAMAVLHAAATVAIAKIAVFQPTEVTFVTVVTLAILVGAAALWSALDAWLGLDRAARTWFIAALVAGPVAGVLSVVGRAVFVDQTGVDALGPALTGGAAFTALMILAPAGLGLLVGGRLGGSRTLDDADDAEDGEDGEDPAEGSDNTDNTDHTDHTAGPAQGPRVGPVG